MRFVRCPSCNTELRLTAVSSRVPDTPFPPSASGLDRSLGDSRIPMTPPGLGDAPPSPLSAYDAFAALGDVPSPPSPAYDADAWERRRSHPGLPPPAPPQASVEVEVVPPTAPQPPVTWAEMIAIEKDEGEDEDTGEHKQMGNGDGSVGSDAQSGKRPRRE